MQRSVAMPTFEALMAEFQDRLYDFCLRMLGDPDEAFDVVQDIFVNVHQSLPTYRADASQATWLFRIAKNHCLNRLKYLKRRRHERLSSGGDEDGIDEPSDAAPGPESQLIAETERRMLAKAIATLEVEQRMLITLRDLEGLSYEEIVHITELPLGTVKSRLHRAREKLIAQLEGWK
jgi:RNA polymerase sigma-70 factor (ECF subfamily)